MKAIKSKRVITAEKKGKVWRVYVKNPNKTESAVCHTKKLLDSREIRTVRDVCIFEINGMEVYM